MKLSVVIAARNEEGQIKDCLESIYFADEIILIDDESHDATVKVAQDYGARVFSRKLDGFASQKNFGIDKADHDWILILDADERVSNQLSQEITELEATDKVAYAIPFKNYLGRKWLRHGGLYPDPHIRLFDRRYALYGSKEVHEELAIKGEVGNLTGHIQHLTYADAGEYLAKVKKYAAVEGGLNQRKPNSPIKVFFDRYFRKKGFLDGWAGLVSAAMLAYYEILLARNMP